MKILFTSDKSSTPAPQTAQLGDRVSPASDMHRESGQTTVVMALCMATFLLGFVALGIDTESLFHAKRQAQAAADAASVAYAEEVNNGSAAQLAAAKAIAKLNGFDTTLATNPATIQVNTPPKYGNYTTSSANSYFEVIVSKPVPMFFAPLTTHHATVTVSARSVAGAGLTSPTCICLEGASGNDLSISGSAKLNPSNCGTTVDSSSSNAATLSGSSSLGGLSIGSVSTNWYPGQISGSASVLSGTKVIQGISNACAPPMPAVPSYDPSQCTASPVSHYNGSASYSVGPGSAYSTTQSGGIVCYTSLSPSGSQKVNINPGIYVISGGSVNISGSVNTTGGNGVFFYLVNGASINLSGSASMSITANTSGTYAGILIYQDSSDSQSMTLSGSSNTSINGAIYAPAAKLTMSGSSETIDSDIVAKTMTLSGSSTLNSPATSNFGSMNISTAKLGE